MVEILFNRDCAGWTKNAEMNYCFLIRQFVYLRMLAANQGYLYLNTIYECLGAVWDPDRENKCYRNSEFNYTLCPQDDESWLITIY
jgi:hypothetical protein